MDMVRKGEMTRIGVLIYLKVRIGARLNWSGGGAASCCGGGEGATCYHVVDVPRRAVPCDDAVTARTFILG